MAGGQADPEGQSRVRAKPDWSWRRCHDPLRGANPVSCRVVDTAPNAIEGGIEEKTRVHCPKCRPKAGAVPGARFPSGAYGP